MPVNELPIWHFAAGIALFVFAMRLLDQVMKQLAGRTFKKYLEKQTSSKLKAITGGAIATALLQSSSVVNLTVLSFVGAGVLSMKHALSVVMGANLGTTLSSWIIALLGFKLNLEIITYPLLALSLIGLFFSSKSTVYQVTQFCIGFSLVFIGIEWMKESALVLVQHIDLSTLNRYSPYLFILLGFAFTGTIQSSSAMMAITLTALHSGSIDFIHAAGIVIGSELGTSLKVLLGGFSGNADKKRVAFGNFYFNLFTLLLASAILYPVTWVLMDVLYISDSLLAIVMFQSAINLLSIIIFYPITEWFALQIQAHVKDNEDQVVTRYLQYASVQQPDSAADAVNKELSHLFMMCVLLHKKAFELQTDEKQLSLFETIRGINTANYEYQYEQFKMLHGEIVKFLSELSSETNDKALQQAIVNDMDISNNLLRASKNIKDIKHNIDELRESANDTIFKQYQNLQIIEDEFLNSLQSLKRDNELNLDKLQESLKTIYNELAQKALHQLSKGLIKENEISSLLNIYRELYSSHKAMLLALDVMHSN